MDKQQLLQTVADKLKDQDLFPAKNAAAKAFLEKAVFVGQPTEHEESLNKPDPEATEKID